MVSISSEHEKQNLHIAFSGGRTSAYMTKWILDRIRDQYAQVKIVFANTGQEHERTLEFIDMCDKRFRLDVVWVEASVLSTTKGVGTSHRIVDFKTASRNGEPFEAVIAKFGIPNQTWQVCSRELKANAVRSYLRSIGWKRRDYVSAIGIRADEVHRISSNCERDRLIYPLAELHPVTKDDILRWWRKQPFDLQLREHMGNCTWCWKKSKRKLLTLANEDPAIFDFPARMEEQYSHVGLEENARVFFRGRTSTVQLLEEAKSPFRTWTENDQQEYFDFDFDAPNGCSESCEPF